MTELQPPRPTYNDVTSVVFEPELARAHLFTAHQVGQ